MTIRTTITALQSLHSGISGIVSAPTERPTKVSTAQLPCVLLRPRALDITADTRQTTNRVRQYDGVVLVDTPQQGRGIAETLERTYTLLEAFADRYTLAINDTETAGDGTIVSYRDSGEPEALIEYQATAYEGFTFTVEVWEG